MPHQPEIIVRWWCSQYYNESELPVEAAKGVSHAGPTVDSGYLFVSGV